MKMKIRVSFSGALMLAALILTHSYFSLAAIAVAFLHEMGHICAARMCGIALKELKLDIFGAAITPASSFYSYRQETVLAAAGPIVNIVLGFALLPFYKCGEWVQMLTVASFFLGTLNLLPIEGFDGGRVLYCILAVRLSQGAVDRICGAISFLTIFLIWSLSVYLILTLGASLSLFVFSYTLLCKMIGKAKA